MTKWSYPGYETGNMVNIYHLTIDKLQSGQSLKH